MAKKHKLHLEKPVYQRAYLQYQTLVGQHPYVIRFIAVGLCLSWVLTMIVVTGCTFLLVGTTTGQDDVNDFSGLGLFQRAYYKNNHIIGCIAYPAAGKNEFDIPFLIGRSFGIITLILVTTSLVSFMVLLGFIKYSSFKKRIWQIATKMCLASALGTQILTFAAFFIVAMSAFTRFPL